MEWGDMWSSEARGTVSGWKRKLIGGWSGRSRLMTKRRLLLVRYGPRVALVKKNLIKEVDEERGVEM
jgi:hypothetical protein